jgi:uncharacterized damage-inducible protein DinB
MEQQALLQQYKEDFQRVYDGNPWLGKSIQKSLHGIDAEHAFHRPIPNGHTIVELLRHMISWRQVLIEKLKRSGKPQPPQKTTFQTEKFGKNQSEIWDNLQTEFEKQHGEIQDLLGNLIQKPRKPLPMRVIHGVIQHDIYHLGQIVLLKKSKP